MAINRSNLVDQLSRNYPNFIKRDLSKLIDIIFENIKISLKRGERVELRDIIVLEGKNFKSKFLRNPKTNEKVFVPEKKIIRVKISQKWKKSINE